MKKLLLSIAFIAMGTVATKAQDVKFGVKGGLNISTLNSDEEFIKQLDSRTSYFFGGLAEIKLNDQFSVQPEVLYSTQGAGKKLGKLETIFKADYINIPVMAKYYLAEGLSVEAGPQIGFLTSSKLATYLDGKKMESSDLKNELKSVDFGLNFGAGYSINNINLGVRYNLGLTDLAKKEMSADKNTVKNGVFQVSLGYSF